MIRAFPDILVTQLKVDFMMTLKRGKSFGVCGPGRGTLGLSNFMVTAMVERFVTHLDKFSVAQIMQSVMCSGEHIGLAWQKYSC